MVQTEQSLYPKLSSIYNKIMQLAIAIVLIIIVLNLWISSEYKYNQLIQQHVSHIGNSYTATIAKTVNLMIAEKRTKANKKLLKKYIQSLNSSDFIKDARLYDKSGQLLLSSKNTHSINELFGVSKYNINQSDEFLPFVEELRDNNNKVRGYLSLTINKSFLTTNINANNVDKQQLERLMFIMAVAIGFLLTRGLNRFSRQGYRLKRS